MGIFYKRPLACASFALILSVILTYLLSARIKMIGLICILPLLGVILCFIFRRKAAYPSLYIGLICVGILLGVGRCEIDLASNRFLTEKIGGELDACVRITKITRVNSFGNEYEARVLTEKGKNGGAVVVRTGGEEVFEPGDVVDGSFAVRDLRYEESYSGQQSAYFAKGERVILVLSEQKSIQTDSAGVLGKVRRIQSRSADYFRAQLGEEAGALASAMLLGDRSGISTETVGHFRRAGISHLLAISGLHLAIISGLLDRFLYALRIGKKARGICVLLCCAVYFFFSGCSVSTLRAIFMLAMVTLAFWFHAHPDPLTSLFFAGAVILLVMPYAVFGVSYQLTMLATFGILSFQKQIEFFGRIIPRGNGAGRVFFRVLRGVATSFSVTLSATVAILPIQWYTFGEFYPITFFANILAVPLMTPFLICAIFTPIFASIPIISSFFLFFTKSIATLLLRLAEVFSRTGRAVSLRQDFVPYILIPAFLLILLLLLPELKRAIAWLAAPVSLAVVAFVICLGATGQFTSGRAEVRYYQNGRNDGIVFYGKGGGLICDMTNGSYNSLSREYALLQEMGATEVSVLLLTRYQDGIADSVSAFSARVPIRELWCPMPADRRETQILLALCDLAQKKHMSISIYEHDTPLLIYESIQLTIGSPMYETRSVYPVLQVRAESHSMSFLYISGAYGEYASHRRTESLRNADVLLVGASGPSLHESLPLPIKAERVILTDTAQIKYLEFSKEVEYYCLPDKISLILQN